MSASPPAHPDAPGPATAADAPAGPADRDARTLLRLHLAPGVGPTLGRRLLERFRTPEALFGASEAELRQVHRVGPSTARSLRAALRDSAELADRELDRVERLGAGLVTVADPAYPPLLAQTPDSPLVLFFRGEMSASDPGFNLGVVGSRRCTAYGREQAERFAALLADAGVAIVSGGARGIDSAAHRGALRVAGRTVAVLGCGLAHTYPPENAKLFDEIAAGRGAVVSELPCDTHPAAENFPARNRIISGLSLGVLVIEAPRGSGALITARHALDEHGREVLAVPGRVDSHASAGCHKLIKQGEAALVTAPGDVIEALESQARHLLAGTHGVRFGPPERADGPDLFGRSARGGDGGGGDGPAGVRLTETQRAIADALDASPLHPDEIARRTKLPIHTVRAEITVLELRRVAERVGPTVRRRRGG